MMWVHNRVPEAEPLPDIWFTLFPEYSDFIDYSEMLVIVSQVIMWLSGVVHKLTFTGMVMTGQLHHC